MAIRETAKFGAWHPLARHSKQSMKVFSAKIVSFTNSQKVPPRKFPTLRYCSWVKISGDHVHNSSVIHFAWLSGHFAYDKLVCRRLLLFYWCLGWVQVECSCRLHFPSLLFLLDVFLLLLLLLLLFFSSFFFCVLISMILFICRKYKTKLKSL